MVYFDTSILLAILFKEKSLSKALDFWESSPQRVSSILLEIESLAVIRRVQNKAKVLMLEKLLQDLLKEIELKILDLEIRKVVLENIKLDSLKSLDMIHLATALFFRENVDEPILFCSFDEALIQKANALNFQCLK